MKNLAFLFVAFFACTQIVVAQQLPDNQAPPTDHASDWMQVQSLANGEEIVVTSPSGRRIRCRFSGATGSTLFCDSSGLWARGAYQFDRTEVEKIRHDDGMRNLRITIGMAAAAGFLYGVVAPRGAAQPTPRFVTGLAGAGLGFVAGCAIALPVALLVPGRLVYHHPHSSPMTAKPEPTGPVAPHARL